MPRRPETPVPSAPVPMSATARIRVRYCECDPMGVAHHAAYIPWLEVGRTELLRDGGVTYAQLEAAGVFLVITRLGARYRRPIRYDDLVEVRTRVIGGGRVKIQHEYDVAVVERAGAPADPALDASIPHDLICAAATTELACVDRAGRVQPLPEWLRVGE